MDCGALAGIDSLVYCGTSEGLYVSKNGGDSWTAVPGINTDVNAITVVNSIVYVASAQGLSFSRDQGENWHTFTTADGLGDNYVWDVFVEGNSIYAATRGGLSILDAATPL